MTRRIAGFSHRSRSLSMPIPYATQSDSVRDPIRFRTPPDQIPYANGENTYRHNKRAIQYRY
jgi:hypothetical protein